jgi:hypothetical protein
MNGPHLGNYILFGIGCVLIGGAGIVQIWFRKRASAVGYAMLLYFIGVFFLITGYITP